MKKTDNRVTGQTTWKKRHFVLTAPQLAYYENETDVYLEDADPLGAISMHQVTSVGTSEDTTNGGKSTSRFEVTANIGKTAGANATGSRTYVLESSGGQADSVEAKDWMDKVHTHTCTHARTHTPSHVVNTCTHKMAHVRCCVLIR